MASVAILGIMTSPLISGFQAKFNKQQIITGISRTISLIIFSSIPDSFYQKMLTSS